MNQGAENIVQPGKERGLSKFSRFKEESKLQDDDEESESGDVRSAQASGLNLKVGLLAEKDENRDNIGGPLKFKFTEEKATSSSKHEEHDASSLNMLEVEKNARSEG